MMGTARRAFLVWLVELPFRYVFGLPLAGHRMTDATFLSRGTGWISGAGRRSMTAYFNGGQPLKWDLLSGIERAFWRIVVPAVVFVLLWCWVHAPVLTATAVVVVLGVSLGLAAGARIVQWQRRHHMAEYVLPLARVLGAELGQDPDRPTRWLHVPPNFRDEDAVIRVDLPESFHAGAVGGGDLEDDDDSIGGVAASSRAAVNSLVYERLQLNAAEMTARYSMAGTAPCVEYRHRPRVPARVDLDDIRDDMDKTTKETAFVLGLGRARKPVVLDIDDDSPHVLLSVGTGGGKSTLIGLIASQVLARGGRVVILDPKRGSHRWAIGHPNTVYARDIADIHDALVRVGAEMDRRQRATDEDEDGIKGCPRVVVVVEELNALMERLVAWWQEQREASKGSHEELPKTCPSVSVLRETAYMGREPMMHLLSAAQQATAAAMGGGAARENFAARVMGKGTSPQTWAFLAPGKKAKATNRKGRFFLVVAGQIAEFQGPNMKRKELRDIAWSCFEDEADEKAARGRSRSLFFREPGLLAGEVINADAPVTVGGSSQVSGEVSTSPSLLGEGEIVSEDQGPVGEAEAPDDEAPPAAESGPEGRRELTLVESPKEEPVSLSEAVASEIVSCSLAVLRKARSTRDPEFPRPVAQRGQAQLFDPQELRRWERNRPRAMGKESA